ncbi:conserved unknown protein [Ectocarpus siliculosus]|uniref:Uncharacterized protein n=1 Tax=Ectocarpus siliculosus TaxID=2880 RepID=D8LQP9_ECTSI|nr:conserved unknown protein [Ectocarpus siliculosus]|eukprot:CBN74926.1 conserved unknown protein [Ectocarpus siliculosus]
MGEEEAKMSLHEALTMQLDEMELLETAYPELTFDTPDARPLLRAALDGSFERQHTSDQKAEEIRLQEALADTPLLSFRCTLPLKEAQLRVRLPHEYPDAPLLVKVEGTPQLTVSARKAISDAVTDEATRLSRDNRREPQCLEVLGAAMQTSVDLADRESTGGQASQAGGCHEISGCGGGGMTTSAAPCLPHTCSSEGEERGISHHSNNVGATKRVVSNSGEPDGEPVFLGRRLIYSHHIIATQKRTGIMKAARDLRLGGFSKVGWPGVIVVEGEEGSCEDFVSTLRGWRWKHLTVRGEEKVRVPNGRTLDQERRLPALLIELGEKEGVSVLAKHCREAGLGELFSTLLR